MIRLGEIPAEPPGYQPRPDLIEQLTRATANQGCAVLHALTGLRGVGKTQLAAAYTRARIADGWPVIAWINGESPDHLISGLADLADQLGLGVPEEDDSTTAAHAARTWLQTTTAPALLIIDNAEHPTTLKPWIPTTGTTHVVITTTNRAFATTATGVPVDVFTQDQAITFLDGQTDLNDSDGARELGEALGYLPLALAQAAWLITTQGKTYPTYLTQLRNQPLAKTLRATANYPCGVPEALLLTIDQTEANDPTDTTHHVLDTLALLSPTGAPRTLLTSLVNAPAEQIDNVLGTLAEASLITYTLDRTGVIMHRLVQHTLRDRAAHQHTLSNLANHIAQSLGSHTIPEDEAWARRTEAAQLIDQVTALADHLHTSRPPSTAAPIPLPKLQLWALKRGAADVEPPAPLRKLHRWALKRGAVENEAPRPLLKLQLWSLKHLVAIADFNRAINLGTQLMVDAEARPWKDDWITDNVIDKLATAYEESGHHTQAIPLFQRALAISQRRGGPDHQDTLTSRSNLASAYNSAGRHSEAITLHQQTLADQERILGPDHPHTLTSRNNLASAYNSAGRHDEALALHQQTLADQERILGPDHPHTLTSRNNLASAYNSAGRHDEALALHQQTLADQERILGPDHPHTLTSRNNLATAYNSAGRHSEAITLYQQTLADRERILGPDHPGTLSSRSNLATAYFSAGRKSEAIALHQQTLADRERILGPDHPDTLTSRNNLTHTRQRSSQQAGGIRGRNGKKKRRKK